jgi:hypothetical protein
VGLDLVRGHFVTEGHRRNKPIVGGSVSESSSSISDL